MFLYSKCVLQDETKLKNENCIVFCFFFVFLPKDFETNNES